MNKVPLKKNASNNLIIKPEFFKIYKEIIYPKIISLCFGVFAFSIFIYLSA